MEKAFDKKTAKPDESGQAQHIPWTPQCSQEQGFSPTCMIELISDELIKTIKSNPRTLIKKHSTCSGSNQEQPRASMTRSSNTSHPPATVHYRELYYESALSTSINSKNLTWLQHCACLCSKALLATWRWHHKFSKLKLSRNSVQN